MTRKSVLVLGAGYPLTGGIASVIHDQFSSPLSRLFHLVLFDTRKRTRQRRTLVEGVVAQLLLLVAYLVKLLTLRPDLVHIHAGGGEDIFRKGWDVWLARICRRRVLLHVHGGDFDKYFRAENQRQLRRVQWIFQQCHGIIALSEFWRSLFVRIMEGRSIYVVNNCVDVNRYRSIDRVAARQALNLPAHALIVLHLGSQGIRKGTFDLLRATCRVLEAVPETVFLFVGPDEDTQIGAIEEGQALAAELGVSHAVRFLGARTGQQKMQCLGAADLFVLPSYNENFPISVLEAMACGLPVVATSVGGIPEMLGNAAPKDLIEPGDMTSLATRIAAYGKNPALRCESGRRNQRPPWDDSIWTYSRSV